jgi:hypothetical protein
VAAGPRRAANWLHRRHRQPQPANVRTSGSGRFCFGSSSSCSTRRGFVHAPSSRTPIQPCAGQGATSSPEHRHVPNGTRASCVSPEISRLALAPPLLISRHIMRKQLFAVLVTAGLFASPLAYADDNDTDATQEPSHADPTTKTLPTTASATAKANAFGQQGARERAAHQAAKAAAMGEAKKAAGQAIAASHRNSHATTHGSGSNASSHAAAGLDRAATASGGRAHPH